jgi:ribosomal-protein-alanine N-acetyltransferase
MSRPNLTFAIEPMAPADIAAVIALEQLAYGPTVSHRDYTHELSHNPLAHYFVLKSSLSVGSAADSLPILVGVGGFWLIAGEAHIITLATHPDWQRLGLGEWLLLNLLEQVRFRGAEEVTLEVRPSNRPAFALYQKYRFREVGQRIGYYDNGENAFILSTPPLHSAEYQLLLTRHKTSLRQRLAQTKVDKLRQID